MTNFFSVQCIIKQLLDSVFVISRIIEVSVRVITKTSSNNCLLWGVFSDSAQVDWYTVTTKTPLGIVNRQLL